MKLDGRAEDMVKPAPRYAAIAAACRLMGMDIADDDYEKMDLLIEAQAEPPAIVPANVQDMT